MYSDRSTTILIMVGCPIRIPPDQRLFAPPRSFSQLITSFIASMCLGIPRTPLVALPKCCSWRWLGYIESPDRWFNLSNFQIVKKQNFFDVELTGIEPATYSVQGNCSPSWATAPIKWWAYVDSNHGPHPYQRCALTSWAISPMYKL